MAPPFQPMSAGPRAPAWFPKADDYARMASSSAHLVREGPSRPEFAFSERHLQCVWADPSLRPRTLTTHQGETVIVEDPGVWNLEAGPDFLGAALRIEPLSRRIAGDVEIHIRPADWKHHGHHRDPRYARVVAHVTFYPGRLAPESLPRGTLQIALQGALQSNPCFSFESIDLTAYPYAERAVVPPCRTELASWAPDERAALLTAAGQERLRRKTERVRATMRERGADQVLYEEVLAALGYKHNKIPFRLLAQRLPVAELRAASQGDRGIAFALLTGVSGLFPRRISARWSAESRGYAREVWDTWWKRAAAFSGREMETTQWRLSNLRPANHPLRRMMAAAGLFGTRPDWLEPINQVARKPNPVKGLIRILMETTRRTGTFWDRHLTFSSRPAPKPVALLGEERARAIVLNVFIPWLAAQDPRAAAALVQDAAYGPLEEDNAVIQQTAYNLFGPDHSARLYANGQRSQGLMQIFHDFCLNDRSRCATCPFPGLLRIHRSRVHLVIRLQLTLTLVLSSYLMCAPCHFQSGQNQTEGLCHSTLNIGEIGGYVTLTVTTEHK